MSPLTRNPWARHGTGLLLAALAGLLCAPVAARAACGDYVVIGGPHPAAAHPRHVAPDSPAHPARDPAPCSGPLCSRGTPPLPVPPAPPAPTQAEQWGCIPAPLLVAAAGPAVWLDDPAPAHPVRRGGGVYHPPRGPVVIP